MSIYFTSDNHFYHKNVLKFGQPISLDDDLIPYLNYINPKVEELFQMERGN